MMFWRMGGRRGGESEVGLNVCVDAVKSLRMYRSSME